MIHYRNDVRRSGIDGRRLRSAARRLLEATQQRGTSLSLWIVGDETMRTLNKRYRGKDRPTDVLSFPGAEDLLGDVVISVETARRQAAGYGAPLQREIERLLIHGIVHLLGHDHERPAQRRKMQNEERRLAERIGMPWPY